MIVARTLRSLSTLARAAVFVVCVVSGCTKEDRVTREERCARLIEEALVAATHPGGQVGIEGVEKLVSHWTTLAGGLAAYGPVGAKALREAIKVQGPGDARAYLIGMLLRFNSEDVEQAVQEAATRDLSVQERTVVSSLLANYKEAWVKELALEWSCAADDRIRLNATAALCQFRDPACSSRLCYLLTQDQSERVRKNAAATGTAGAVTGTQDELQSLCGATGDSDQGVRNNAAHSIRSIVDLDALPIGLAAGEPDYVAWYGDTGKRLVWDTDAGLFRTVRARKR